MATKKAKDLVEGDRVDLESVTIITDPVDRAMAEMEYAVVTESKTDGIGSLVHFESHTSLWINSGYEFVLAPTD